jgi:fibronectin-binding autotransporter adhesin
MRKQNSNSTPSPAPNRFGRRIAMLVSSVLASTIIFAMTPVLRAQTIALNPTNINLFVGANYSGTYSNFQLRAVLSGTGETPVVLSVPTPPAGVTVTFSTNNFTNSTVVTLSVAVAGVAKGVYPLSIAASGPASYTTNINLIAGTLWTNLSGGDVNWTTAANWSAGAPGLGDAVIFQDAGLNTNHVNSSVTVDSLAYLRSLSGTNQNTTIASGATLSVVGTNGFAVNVDSTTGNNKTTTLNVYGAGGNLVVSNSSANFTINSDNTGANATIVNMTNLDKMTVVVSRFGLGDATMNNQGGVGAQNVTVFLARTNYIQAGYTSDLTGTNGLTFGFSLFNNTDTFNNGSANTLNLGFTNAIFADNIAIGQARCGSSANVVRFAQVFTNGNGASAYFRNTNGGRVSLLAVGVDSGANAPGSNARSTLLFNGGTLDMLLDNLWLGRVRNSVLTNNNALSEGILTFGPGKVDVNIARLGYNVYTNNSWSRGTINVNSNGTLVVNDYMEMGYVAGDYLNGSAAAQTFGLLTVNGGGVARAKQIIVRPGSTNNVINLNVNGSLTVSNTIGSATTALTRLTMDGGALSLFVASGTTNVFVTNLVTTVNASKINIASLSGFASFPATNVLIAYQTAAAHNIGIGTTPAGFNNLQINDNTDNKTIELVINTNQPKTLVWRGGQNSNWDHASLNWLDLNAVTITKFTDGDYVTFDDLPGVPTAINVAETILPGQTGTGIIVTNQANSFAFSGSGSIGNASFVKLGAGSVQLDISTAVSAQVQEGSFSGAGTVGSLSVSTGASINFSGIVSGALQTAGSGSIGLGGTVSGAVTVQSGGALTNAGTFEGGSLTVQSGSLLYNSGSLKSIGAATVATNSTLINAGTIGLGSTPNSLTISGTFEDTGAGSLTVDSLTINGGATFIPGGSGIGTTTIFSTGNGATPGLVRLLQNSTNIFKLDFAHPQTNSLILATRFVFGPSQTTKANNGATVIINNIGATPFSAGQELKLFGSSDGGASFFDAGLNTTNSYPMIQPATPGAGLAWDAITQVIPYGIIKVTGVSTSPVSLTNVVAIVNEGSNVVSTLQWPTDHTGWRLQQQANPLTVGLSTNWTDIFGSTLTNEMSITNAFTTNAVFFRMLFP